MDLMSQYTNYLFLRTKYRSFAAPTARITVDGTELVEKLHAAISDLRVDLTCEYPASGCSFDVIGEYQPNQTNFNTRGCAKVLQIGAKVEIALGYIQTEKIFMGLITEVEYRFDLEAAPTLHVECMDAKCLLMKTQRLELLGECKVAQAVNTLLSSEPVSSYLDGKSVTVPNDEKQPLGLHMVSDYDFIVGQAQYFGCEFFIFNGKAYFRRTPAAGMPIMELGINSGLLSASLTLQGAELVNEVRVVGIDPGTDKEVSGKEKISGKFSKGSTAKKMLSGTERVYFDPLAATASEAQARAKTLLSGMAGHFGLLKATCIGLPDLIPGRLIKVVGLTDEAQRNFYITQVHHSYGPDGFSTSLEAKVKSL